MDQLFMMKTNTNKTTKKQRHEKIRTRKRKQEIKRRIEK